MTANNVKIFETEEVQNFINLLSGLEQEGGNPRTKQIIHRVVSDLFKIIEDLKNALINPPADFPKIKDIITVDGIRVIFEKGWGLVRASNTTPKLVTRFEADTKENAKIYENVLMKLFEQLQGK